MNSILLFHSKKPETYDRLVESCDAVAASGGRLVGVDAFLDASVPGPKTLLTFDDGYEHLDGRIATLLRDRAVRALAFVIPFTGDMSALRFDHKYYRENADAFEAGSHSMSHSYVHSVAGSELSTNARVERQSILRYNPIDDSPTTLQTSPALLSREWLPLLGRSETDVERVARVRADLWMSRNIIERMLGQRCRFFAYPWGLYDASLKTSVTSAGYEAAFTVSKTDGDIMTIRRTLVT